MIHVSEFARKMGYVSSAPSGRADDSYHSLSLLSAADLFGQAEPPPSGGVPAPDQFIQHKLYCSEGCSWCSQFRYDKASDTVVKV